VPRKPTVAALSSAVVIGGAGFIGSHLVDRLLVDDVTIDVVDDFTTGSLANLAEARARGGRLSIQQLDAAAPELSTLLERRAPEVLYLVRGLGSDARDPLLAVEALAVLVACLEVVRSVSPKSKVVVVLPASQVYGEIPLRDLPVREDHERVPTTVSGIIANSMLEVLAGYRDRHAVEYTALVMPTVYGPRMRPDSNVVAAALAARDNGIEFAIHGDGRQTRDLLWIDDAVDALVRAAGKGGGLALNIGTGVQTNVRDIWRTVGSGAPAANAPKRTHHVSRVALSSARARLHLGWAPFTTVDDGLSRLLG